MIDVEQVLTGRFPVLGRGAGTLLRRPLVGMLRRLFHEREVNRFLEAHRGVAGIEFVEQVLDYFDLSYRVSNRDRENIPVQGRVVIIANHPLGALDALALIKLVSEVRRDVRIVANELLMQLRPLHSLLLPVDNLGGATTRADLRRIDQALEAEQAVIIFPAGEVSRVRPSGIRDGRWSDGFLRIARRAEAPLLPVFIQARNSSLFYAVSMFYKPLAALLLVQEMFRQRSNTIGFRVGNLIPLPRLKLDGLSRKEQLKLVRRHFFRVAKGKQGPLESETAIAHPVSRQGLRAELGRAERLGATRDGKIIYLADYRPDSELLEEIGRLRELTFRKVGEGTGRRRDLDRYDQHYRHLVLWDEQALEVVGAYRIGEVARIRAAEGLDGLYTASLFRLGPGFLPYTDHALELGRSFVQPAYWGSRALDYLWQGLGAYLRSRPEVRYLFGPVSISQHYPAEARDLIVGYYRRHYGGDPTLVTSRNPLTYSRQGREACERLFDGHNAEEDFARLKDHLAEWGLTVPTLYKQYSELCEPGGTQFLDFGVDAEFGHCVDGFILVDLAKLRPKKRERYIGGA